MPSRGQSLTLSYVAWDTGTNTGKTGDAGNHALRWVKDGALTTPTNLPSEVDAANAPGIYSLALTTLECTCDYATLGGVSSSTNIVIMPISVSFESLPLLLVSGRVDANVGTWRGVVPNNLINNLVAVDAQIVSDKLEYSLSAAEHVALADAIFDRINGVETGWTLRQTQRLMAAALVGKLAGAATTNVTIRDLNDAKTRINAIVDTDGNRTTVTKDVT